MTLSVTYLKKRRQIRWKCFKTNKPVLHSTPFWSDSNSNLKNATLSGWTMNCHSTTCVFFICLVGWKSLWKTHENTRQVNVNWRRNNFMRLNSVFIIWFVLSMCATLYFFRRLLSHLANPCTYRTLQGLTC